MTTMRAMSDSGIQAVGELPLGSHFCQFYRTRQDLIDTLVPFFMAGLRAGELCMWVTSQPLEAAEAEALLREAMPDFDDYAGRGQIEIWDYRDWYLANGQTATGVLQGWIEREERALRQGFAGLRLTGNTFWLEPGMWDAFMAYEAGVNEAFSRRRIVALCSYSLDRCAAEDVIDVCHNHQFALTRRKGGWELIESSSLKIAKTELAKLNGELEERVAGRTAELQDSLRARDEFLAMLAHELRNPLAPIRNAAQVIRLLGTPDPNLGWARSVIDRQVHQLSRLVDDLLDVSRVTRGRVELQREEIDLATVVAHAVETSRPLIDGRRHTLLLSLPPEPVLLHADLSRLSQVVANLLNNAAKYMDEGGSIRLTAERAGGEVKIRVRDQGIGIPPEMLPRIFDLFTQADRSLAHSQGGLGIGLALVRSLVELHGGTVEAFSEGPGHGAELVVTLPASSSRRPADTLSGSCEPPRAAMARDILVVDDNVDAAETLGRILELAGHQVRIAHDGEQALELAANWQPDAVLLDIGLPKLDGYEVARRLRLDPGLRGTLLVAVTGYGKEEDRDRGRAAGFDHHMVKPVDLAALQGLLAGCPGSTAAS